MTYAEAVARLLALRGGEYAGMEPGLARIEGLLEALGHPERRYELVQIGGTNGKGSVAAMVATALKYAGHRVGLYTSPHLLSFRERIRVNGEPIAEDAVADGVDALGTLIARFNATMFEATTALALDHFAREAVDLAVLEVGLGGRLDATTVGTPRVSVLTPIDLDHEAYLGASLTAIAEEKAAIIRAGVAVSAAQAPEVIAVLAARAARAGVPLVVEGRDLRVEVERRRRDGQWIRCRGPNWELADLELSLLGVYQPHNALVAVTAARELGAPEAAIREALRRVRWPGRFDVVGEGPWLVFDGAHNPAGARALASSISEFFGRQPLTLIFGVSRDKNAGAMLAALVPLARRVILTRFANPRSADPAELAVLVKGPPSEVASSVAEAVRLATAGGGDPVTCVAGSLFLVAEALGELAGGRRDTPCPIEKPAASMEPLQ